MPQPYEKTPNPNAPHGVQWFSDSTALAELACLIDALPKRHRPPILRAALQCTADPRVEAAYIVGTFRTQFYHCVEERLGRFPAIAAIRQIDPNALDARLQPFGHADDPAQTTLALCDLLVLVVDELAVERACAPENEARV